MLLNEPRLPKRRRGAPERPPSQFKHTKILTTLDHARLDHVAFEDIDFAALDHVVAHGVLEIQAHAAFDRGVKLLLVLHAAESAIDEDGGRQA